MALRSMHVMCALITPGFKESDYTDQEVGVALGREVPTILVKASDVRPYGLMGKHSGTRSKTVRPGSHSVWYCCNAPRPRATREHSLPRASSPGWQMQLALRMPKRVRN